MVTTLLLVQRQSLQLFISDRATPVAVMVPETTIRDMEVVNENELTALLRKVLPVASPHVQPQITIIISEDLCFVAPYDAQHPEEVALKLQNESPFAHVAIATVLTQVTPVVIATNQELYETIGRVLESCHYTVSGVYPWRALQLGEMAKPNSVFDIAATKRFCESPAVYRGTAFEYKTTVPLMTSTVVTAGVSVKKKFPVGWFVFGALALLYAGVMLYIMFR